jgi:hypothetical protein
VAVHVLLDYVFVAILIASPFVFGFSSETNPTAVFIALGVLHLLVSVATRFKKQPPDGEGGEERGRRGRRRNRDRESISSGDAGDAGDSGVPEFELPRRGERD